MVLGVHQCSSLVAGSRYHVDGAVVEAKISRFQGIGRSDWMRREGSCLYVVNFLTK